MIIKVDNEELTMFTKNMIVDSNELSKEIDTMKSLINELAGVWQGIDSTTFQKNVTEYLEKMKVVPKAITTLANVTQKINDGYTQRDQEFAKALEEVANKYAR